MAKTSSLGAGGSFDGIPPLGAFTGVANIFPPHWCVVDSAGDVLTSTRLYYIPYYFNETRQFTGLKTYNTGTGDNGKTFRMGVYQATLLATGLRGGPSSLVADCGQVTLTGAAAERTLASAFTPAYVGWHYLAFHTNTDPTMAFIQAHRQITAAGQVMGNSMRYAFGASQINLAPSANTFGAYYVDTAYGALAASAVAPTAVINLAPLVAPYLT